MVHRHAGRLCAGPGGADRRAVDRHAARRRDDPARRRASTSSRCWRFPSSCWPAPSWPRAAWRGGWWPSPACWSASSAAACRWSTSWPRPSSARSRARRWPTPASIGSVLIPEMEKKGYPRAFATAVTVSGSVQAILIPPSHNAVIYSLAAGGTVSIAALFIAGVLPGLLMGLTLAVLCLIIARQRELPEGRGHSAAPGAEDLRRRAVGTDDDGHHPRRHPVGVFTANESASIAVRVGLLRHDVRLPRLQVARPAQAGPPHRQDGDHRDDPDRLRGLLRLPDDADADPAEGDRLLHQRVRQQVRHPGADQRHAAGAGHA